MNKVHPLIRIGGPILGALIVFYVINAGVDSFRADRQAARDAERLAALAAAEEEQQSNGEEAAESDEAEPSDAEVADAEALEPEVYFLQPTSFAIVPTTFTVVMGVQGLAVEPSGEINDGAGHFHILVNTDFIPAGQVIPTDERHLHFGDGSFDAELTLPPGEHTLHLQFADGAHIALEGEEYRDTIVVFVEEGAAATSTAIFDPLDGAALSSPFNVVMTAAGLIVEPSGEINDGAGHFHILVNTDFIPAGQVIPTDEQHLHFGQAQTSAELDLPPGEHTLRLQFADGAHIALEGEEYRDTITVTVEAGAEAPSVRFAQPADGQTVPASFDLEMEAIGLIAFGRDQRGRRPLPHPRQHRLHPRRPGHPHR